jgi:diguanylate cyclase (GGDEF)-like protein/PAS domain S-box-containing protein
MPRRAGAAAHRGGAGLAAIAISDEGATARPAPMPTAGPARAASFPPAATPEARTAPRLLVPEPGTHGSPGTPDGAELPRRRRSDAGSGPRLRRILADQSNQPVASGLLHLDPILVALADSERHFRALIEQAADGIVVVDGLGRITLANSRACEMLGCGATEVVGLDLVETYLPEERDLGRRSLEQPPGTSMRFERQLLRRDGATMPIDVSVAWLGNGERQLIMRDVTARQRAESAQLAEERRLRSLLRISEVECASVPELLNVTLAEVVALSDSAFGYIYAYDESHAVFTLHSWSRESSDSSEASEIGDPTWTYELAKSGIWAEVETHRQPIVVNDLPGPMPVDGQGLDGQDPDGDAAPVSRFMTIPVISHDQIVAVVGVANKADPYTDVDVSQLTQIMDVVWKIADRHQNEDRLRQFAEQLETRVELRTHEFERANAELEAANLEIAAANGELQTLLREQERLQNELAYRVLHDPLTGLANRTMFQERLDHAFRVSDRGVAVLWIDLDHFKEVNDIFGHDVGDEMLIAVADRLREVVRDTDDIARMGGDEFAVVLPNVVEDEAQLVGERVLTALTDRDAFRLQVGASVGVGWQRNTTGDARVLIRRADQAMYRAKAAGGGQTIMY